MKQQATQSDMIRKRRWIKMVRKEKEEFVWLSVTDRRVEWVLSGSRFAAVVVVVVVVFVVSLIASIILNLEFRKNNMSLMPIASPYLLRLRSLIL